MLNTLHKFAITSSPPSSFQRIVFFSLSLFSFSFEKVFIYLIPPPHCIFKPEWQMITSRGVWGDRRRRRRPALLLPPLCSLFVIDELKVVRER
jgi:hypothetical protein